MKEEHIMETTESRLYDDVCAIIEDTRYRVAVYVNSEACRMNWQVGMRIEEDVLHNARAEHGKKVVKHLAERLVKKYGNGWGFKKLQDCLRAAYTFIEAEIDYAVRSQFIWTHLRYLNRNGCRDGEEAPIGLILQYMVKRILIFERECLTLNSWLKNHL